MKNRWLQLAAVGLLTAACDQKATFDRFVPKDDAAYGQRVLDQLRRRDFAAVENALNPAVKAAGAVRTQLEQAAAAFPAGAPKNIRVIGAFTNTDVINGTRLVSLTYEYEFPKQWLLANIVLRQEAGRRLIEGLHVQQTVASQEELNSFAAPGKRWGHYVVLLWTVLVPLFILGAFGVLLRTKVPRRRWLWGLFVLVGLGHLSFNWTSGEVRLQMVYVTILGSGFFKAAPVGPLTLMTSLPVGAFVFLWKRRSWLANVPLRPTSGEADGVEMAES